MRLRFRKRRPEIVTVVLFWDAAEIGTARVPRNQLANAGFVQFIPNIEFRLDEQVLRQLNFHPFVEASYLSVRVADDRV